MKKIATWLAIFLLGTLLGGLIVWIYGGFLYRDWSFSWQWSVAGQPLATFGAGIAAIIAAWIALHNGKKTREQDKEIHEAKSQAEQESILRERFTSIVELLATDDLTKRESGVYAMAALADDWAAFYKDDQKSALREQQVCLNILISQLRDPILDNSPPQIKTFKEKIQDIIFSRFEGNNNEEPGQWSTLNLVAEHCYFYNLSSKGIFKQRASFLNAHFHGKTSFSSTHFYNNATFSDTCFHDGATFNDARFYDGATFHGTLFCESVSFERARFNIDTPFDSNNKYENCANFSEIEFYNNASFFRAKFYNNASFNGTHFNNNTPPRTDIEYHKHADFSFSHFYGMASFHGSHFHKCAHFLRAHFDETAWFKASRFESFASFQRSNFNAQIFFEDTHFKGRTDFQDANFEGPAHFDDAKFLLPISSKSNKFIKSLNINLENVGFGVNFFPKRLAPSKASSRLSILQIRFSSLLKSFMNF